jgi:SAM-dependent methyltransferase
MTLLGSSSSAERENSASPYDPLAPHYDAFIGAPRYGDWLDCLLGLAAAHGHGGGVALDVGCGTGRSVAALIAAGYRASGCDPSPAMLREARARLGDEVQLGVSALPEPLPPGPRADLVTAFNDVLNHVAPSALRAAITVLADRLHSGGLLLFDANTPLTYATFFGSSHCRDAGERFFVWEPCFSDGDTHAADLHAFVADAATPNTWHRSVSHHVQHHHAHARITDALSCAGFALLELRGQREDGGVDEHCDDAVHTKRIYLARRR